MVNMCNASTDVPYVLDNSYSQMVTIDALDSDLIALLTDEPRIGVLELSRRLRVARGTVQSRLDKPTERGVIRGIGPDVGARGLGFEVNALLTLGIRQCTAREPRARSPPPIPGG